MLKNRKLFVTSNSLWTSRSQTCRSNNSFWSKIPVRSMSRVLVPLLCKVTVPEKYSPRYFAVDCVEQGIAQGCFAPWVWRRGSTAGVPWGGGPGWVSISATALFPWQYSGLSLALFFHSSNAFQVANCTALLSCHGLASCDLAGRMIFLPTAWSCDRERIMEPFNAHAEGKDL